MAALIALATAAAAATWWVADDDEAAALSAALAEVWPEHDVAIEVGAVESDVDPVYLYADGETLVLVMPGAPPRRADVADWPTRAVLARSWTRRVVVAAPPPPPPPAPSPPPPPLPIRASSGGPWATATFGAGSRYPDPLPSIRLSLATGLGWDRLALGLGVDLEVGEVVRTPAGEGWFVRRFGIGAEGHLALIEAERWDLALLGRPALRFIRAERLGPSSEQEAQALPSFAAGLAARARGGAALQPTLRAEVVIDARSVLPGDVLVRPVGVFALVGGAYRRPVKDRGPVRH